MTHELQPYGTGINGRTLVEQVRHARSAFADTPIWYVDPARERKMSVAELLGKAECVAWGMRDAGVSPGDHVVLQLPNLPEAAIAQLAAIMVGCVTTPIVPVMKSSELEQILTDSRPKMLLTTSTWRSNDYLAELGRVDAVRLPENVVVIDSEEASIGTTWARLLAAPALERWTTVDEDALALQFYTSGSTGRPKGVQHSHRTVVAEAGQAHYRATGTERDCLLQPSGAGHVAGVYYLFRGPLGYGIPTVVMDGWDADLAAEMVGRHGVNAMPATPYHLDRLMVAAAERGIDLSTLDGVSVGGAPVRPQLVEDAQEIGITAARIYGSSEHPTVTGGRLDPLHRRAHTDGRAIGGNEIRIVGPDGERLGAGEVGEVHTRGPEMFLGYSGAAAQTCFTPDGWYASGDVGVLDEEGYLTVVDRIKNVIIRGGENLSAVEIEDAVHRFEGVAEVGVVGYRDETMGERACAVVVMAEGRVAPGLAELAAHFDRLGIAKQKIPERIVEADAMPRTANGKLDRPALRELAAGLDQAVTP